MRTVFQAPTARFKASPGQRPGNKTENNHPALKGRFKRLNLSPVFTSTSFSTKNRKRILHNAVRTSPPFQGFGIGGNMITRALLGWHSPPRWG
jgi:hypothetical protein